MCNRPTVVDFIEKLNQGDVKMPLIPVDFNIEIRFDYSAVFLWSFSANPHPLGIHIDLKIETGKISRSILARISA